MHDTVNIVHMYTPGIDLRAFCMDMSEPCTEAFTSAS